MALKYTAINLFAFLLHTATTISLVVFLTSTQSFLLTTQLHTKPGQLGKITGTLTSLDEITCMILSPFVGTFLDYLSSSPRGKRPIFNGVSRVFGVTGITLMSLVIFAYTFLHTLWPYLMILRVLFAVGVSCAVGMFGVMLSEVVDSGFQLSRLNPFNDKVNMNYETQRLLEGEEEEPQQQQVDESARKSRGKFSALLGISSGLGAVFAVMVYLPLPDKYETQHGLAPEAAIIRAYKVVSGIGLLTALLLNFTLFRRPQTIINSSSSSCSATLSFAQSNHQYLTLLKSGFQTAIQTPTILLSYFGSFLARSTSILNSVFIPLYIHTHFIQTGQCIVDPDQPLLKESCHEAYVQAMILTGICNTVTLIAAPLFGVIIDLFGSNHALLISFVCGIMSCVGFIISFETLTVFTIVASVCLGLAQIGFIITSMALLTSSPSSHRENIGAITGVYSLFGGVGILVLSGVGGVSVDLAQTGKAVFGVMVAIFIGMGVGCFWLEIKSQIAKPDDDEDGL